MGFRTQQNPGVDWSSSRREIARDESWMLPYLAKNRNARSVAEWGSGSGRRAEWLLSSLAPGAVYRGFDTSSCNGAFPAQVSDPALPLPLGEGSQDIFLALDFLEYLRMDQLYMVVAEARRTLRSGGSCFLRSLSFSSARLSKASAATWNTIRELHPRWVSGRRPLDLSHYISPEDWRTLDDFRHGGPFLNRQTLVLERL